LPDNKKAGHMKEFRYIPDVSTLALDGEKCTGCGMCETVCPHGVLEIVERKAQIVDLNGCMECGACSKNCPVEAVMVTPGVGCAAYIIQTWIKGKDSGSCDGATCC